MSNVLRRAYQRFETEVESDKYSTGQRLAAAACVGVFLAGGLKITSEFGIDEYVIDGIASVVGHDEPINYYDNQLHNYTN